MSKTSFLLLGFLTLTFVATARGATGQVELELVGSAQLGSPMVFQQWLQTLGRAGVKNVRLRTGQDGDRVGVEVRGTTQTPIYVVTGMINGADEIVLPGARFRRGDMGLLKAWLDDVAQHGPADRREATGAFGFSAKQLERVHGDLARPVGFSTRGMTRSDAVERIGRQLGFPLKIEGDLTGGDERIVEELSSLTCGTSLACILRPIGFAMTPRESGDGFVYAVAKAKLDQTVWPIGWPIKEAQELREKLPALYEYRNVNVAGVPASKVLEVLGDKLKVPILLDHNALARHDIDPDKAVVSHPQMRTNYSMALRKILFKAGLKFEVRIDEAEKPFLWISTVKPV